MKRSTLYLLYPANKALEGAIADGLCLLNEQEAAAAMPGTQVAVADNFRYTRGNYEQHRYSTRIFERLCETLTSSLAASPCAKTQDDLGNILSALGQQRHDAAFFEQAIQCFSRALEGYPQEESPLEWAATQYNLGTANQALGRLIEETGPLKLAVDAYTNALLVWTREAHPEDWMQTMHQLGSTLYTYGIQLKGHRQLQKSVVAYKNALAVLNADDHALTLTATHNNRGITLHHLGESEANPDRLKEAINSYEKALTVSMEQQLPIHVSVLCRVNKATAQNVLAQMSNDAALAEEIADEFEVIMECFRHALQPLCLRHCQEQLKLAQAQTALSSQAAG
ncbi:MAG: tetratricopeptide repeat protein [Gallionella sp.]|jgi:tetratricopeptide (TPR) repeat protein|nr:tetratricopeptide repeat protein [Gallionella sp.]